MFLKKSVLCLLILSVIFIAACSDEPMSEEDIIIKLIIENLSHESLTFIPRMVEKSFFEDIVMPAFPEDSRALQFMRAYYSLKDSSDPALTEDERGFLIAFHPLSERLAFYLYDQYASQREIDEIHGYWQEYAGFITDADIYKMFTDYDIPFMVALSSESKFKISELFMAELGIEPNYNYTEVVPPMYDSISGFRDGLAWVQLDRKWGFVDKSGEVVVPIIYDNVGSFFYEGLAAVMLDGKWGFIDKSGSEVVPFIYDIVEEFHDGLAAVVLGDKWGFIDKTGEVVLPFVYDNVRPFFYDGLAWVVRDGKEGFIDKSGEVITPLIHDNSYWYGDGMVRVEIDGKWGVIDGIGREIVPPVYSGIGRFYDGLARVGHVSDVKYGFVDMTGNEVVPLIYDNAGNFYDGLARVWLRGANWGFIDTIGTEIVPLIYDNARDFSEGLAAVKLGDKWGYIDKSGEVVSPFIYDTANDFSDGVAVVSLYSNINGVIDRNGNILWLNSEYERIDGFSEGLASVRVDGKWGIISIN